MASYSADQIQVLKGLEPVRKRPGMYVGGTDREGLHHLVWEVVGNVIDLHLAGQASELHVSVGPDAWITLRDDGPGVPTSITSEGISMLEVVFTRLHAGATYDGHFPHVHLTKNWRGVGLAVVNALSERLEVETTYQGIRWAQAYERGERVSPPRRIGPTTFEGTTIRFRPDPQIFGQVTLDPAAVGARLQQLAWLNPQLRVVWQEQRLRGRGGVLGWAHSIARERGRVVCSHGVVGAEGDVKVDIGLAWNETGPSRIHGFVNMQPTTGGTHVDGLWTAFVSMPERTTPRLASAHAREAMASAASP
ncbi:MAG TPA: ATP-binding protein [Kofleriaceae bacterium]|nr:ATP-binding protein [Kofleriaceae bacterium]